MDKSAPIVILSGLLAFQPLQAETLDPLCQILNSLGSAEEAQYSKIGLEQTEGAKAQVMFGDDPVIALNDNTDCDFQGSDPAALSFGCTWVYDSDGSQASLDKLASLATHVNGCLTEAMEEQAPGSAFGDDEYYRTKGYLTELSGGDGATNIVIDLSSYRVEIDGRTTYEVGFDLFSPM